jgi:dolichol-phosphate mannosyltransferase
VFGLKSTEATIIIPTMNEEHSIVKVINEIREINQNLEIIVVDKSIDGTKEKVNGLGVKIFHQKTNGKGNAMKLGVKHASNEIIIFIDGDYTYPSKYIPNMIKYMKSNDIVRGSRFYHFRNTGLVNSFGNILFSYLASLFYGRTSDLLTGLYSIRKNVFNQMVLDSTGFEIETEIYIKARKMNLRVKEISIGFRKRIGITKLSSLKDGLNILYTLIRFFIRRSKIKKLKSDFPVSNL